MSVATRWQSPHCRPPCQSFRVLITITSTSFFSYMAFPTFPLVPQDVAVASWVNERMWKRINALLTIFLLRLKTLPRRTCSDSYSNMVTWIIPGDLVPQIHRIWGLGFDSCDMWRKGVTQRRTKIGASIARAEFYTWDAKPQSWITDTARGTTGKRKEKRKQKKLIDALESVTACQAEHTRYLATSYQLKEEVEFRVPSIEFRVSWRAQLLSKRPMRGNSSTWTSTGLTRYKVFSMTALKYQERFPCFPKRSHLRVHIAVGIPCFESP